MIRTRFAPSPTGYLHVGGLRTALYAYLVAKQNGGQFLLRIEDTDRERFVADGTMNILKSLYWAGIVPDEGVVLTRHGEEGSKGSDFSVGTLPQNDSVSQRGNRGPYIQSERLDIYKKYADQLVAQGDAYYCFCSAERLDELRERQQAHKLPTKYDRHCLKLNSEEIQTKLAAGEKHVVRLKMPQEGETVFNDLIRGEVSFKNELIDDQVLMKSDGFPTYHMAVVVDDHLMEITHVVRGEEWVSSTPKHMQLYKCFGWTPPQFAHLPLLLNPDKSKLSKRQGDVAVSDYTAKGYLPEALVNFVAFLGWNPGTDKELYTLDELVKDFSLNKVSKAGAVFNLEKLDWYNKEYIKKLSNTELLHRAKPWLAQSGILDEVRIKNEELRMANVVALEKERITTLAELPGAIKFVFELPDYPKELLVWRKGTVDEVRQVLPVLQVFLEAIDEDDWTKEKLEQKIKDWIQEKGYQTGSVLWPLRVALSGQQNSPGPFEIAGVLGKEESLRRIRAAMQKL